MFKPVFSVIIVAHMTISIVDDCLRSIERYNDLGDQLEVIVVDNSPDQRVHRHICQTFNDPACCRVTSVPNENKGFGEANNRGADLARGRYLLFLNPDTILVEPVFRYAIGQFERHAKLGLFGVRLVSADLRRNMSFYLMDRSGIWAAVASKIANHTDCYIDGCMFIAGADLFVRRELFLACGGFDERIFLYCEESDLTRRIRSEGYQTGYFPARRIIHLEGKSSSHPEKAIRQRMVSKQYYCSKYNLNFIRQVSQEIRLNRIQAIVYGVVNRKQAQICRQKISILEAVRRTYREENTDKPGSSQSGQTGGRP